MAIPDPSLLPVEEAPEIHGPEAPQLTASVTRARLVLRRFLRRKIGIAGVAVIAVLFVAAFVVPIFYPWNHTDPDFEAFFSGPSWEHWFGTNDTGLDLFAQTMRGLQKSLLIGLITALLTTATAALAGTCAGYFGGWPDRILMWIVDLLLALPAFLIIVILSPWFQGGSWWVLPLILAAFGWMITARVIRSMTLSLKEREFVQAARFMGVPSRKIITRHLLPNMASFLIIDGTILVGATILGETGLSYLGFGVQHPDVSLGTVIADNNRYFDTDYWWLYLFPAVTLILTVLSASAVGDSLRDAFDPTSSRASRRLDIEGHMAEEAKASMQILSRD